MTSKKRLYRSQDVPACAVPRRHLSLDTTNWDTGVTDDWQYRQLAACWQYAEAEASLLYVFLVSLFDSKLLLSHGRCNCSSLCQYSSRFCINACLAIIVPSWGQRGAPGTRHCGSLLLSGPAILLPGCHQVDTLWGTNHGREQHRSVQSPVQCHAQWTRGGIVKNEKSSVFDNFINLLDTYLSIRHLLIY